MVPKVRSGLSLIHICLGKDAAYIISRINAFTYVKTQFDYFTSELKIVEERAFSDGERGLG